MGPETSRSTRRTKKALQILDGARSAFLDLGYGGASVDEIARRAGVSKGTLYAHYADKQRLFAAVVEEQAGRTPWLSELSLVDPNALGETPAARARACAQLVADRFIRFLIGPVPQSLFRIVVAESARFPELGRLFYESGPGAGTCHLAGLFRAATEQGVLRADEPRLAARLMCDLCDGYLVRRVRLGLGRPTEDEIQEEVEVVVDLFLRLFGPNPDLRRRSGAG